MPPIVTSAGMTDAARLRPDALYCVIGLKASTR
jgi:hypothetical protein